MFRPILRASPRAAAPLRSAGRGYSASTSIENDFVKEREAVKHHAAKSGELWRKITYYVAFPAIIVGYFNAKSLMNEHEKHIEHIKHENGGELPERVVYDYFNIRHREYPWGPYTLFYNPHVNVPRPDADL